MTNATQILFLLLPNSGMLQMEVRKLMQIKNFNSYLGCENTSM